MDGSDDKHVETLMEMGFIRSQVEKALVSTNGQGLERAMEWLLENAGNGEDEASTQSLKDSVTSKLNDEPAAMDCSQNSKENVDCGPVGEVNESDDCQAKSLVCDICGKTFRSTTEVEFHATKTGHEKFSESTAEVKLLTEEERQEQRKRLEDRIKQRRLERDEQEAREKIEREKTRRKTGQEIILAKQKHQEQEMKKIAEERRREKLEEKLARQRVKEQIESDKLARKEKFGMVNSSSNLADAHVAKPSVSDSSNNSAVMQKTYDQCKLQIRLTNGKSLTQSFGSKEQLAAVRLYVEMNRSDGISEPFSLMTNFPKKIFTVDDMQKPLCELGLVPSAVLIVTKPVSS